MNLCAFCFGFNGEMWDFIVLIPIIAFLFIFCSFIVNRACPRYADWIWVL